MSGTAGGGPAGGGAPSGSVPEALVDALLGTNGATPARLSRVATALASGVRFEDVAAARGDGGGGGSSSGGGSSDVQWLSEGVAARVRQLAGFVAFARGRAAAAGEVGGSEARARAAEAAFEALQHCVTVLNERVRAAEASAGRATSLAWRAQRALERACYAFRDEDATPGVARFLRDALSESGASDEVMAGARAPAMPPAVDPAPPSATAAAAGAVEGNGGGDGGGGGGGGGGVGVPPPPLRFTVSAGVDSAVAAGEVAAQVAKLSMEAAALAAEKARLVEALDAAHEGLEEAAVLSRLKADQVSALSLRCTALETELVRLHAEGGATVGAVLAHPRYQALTRELHEAREGAAAAGERVAPLEAHIAAQAEALSAANARVHMLLALAEQREGAARAFFEARLREMEALLGAAEGARCAEAARAAAAAGAAAAIPALQATLAAAQQAAVDWEAHCGRLTEACKGGGGGGGGDCGDGGSVPMASYLAVAEAYEGVAKTRDAALSQLAARDEALGAALSAGACAEADKGALLARLAAAEAVAGDVEALRRETRALLATRDGAVEAAEARAGEAAEAAARAGAAGRGGARSGGGGGGGGDAATARELRAQNEALGTRAEEAEARAVEALKRCEVEAAAAAAGREAEAAALKRLAREERKHRETRAALEAAGRSASLGPGPSPTASATTPGSLYAPASEAARMQAEISSLKGLVVCSVCNGANKDTILLRCSHTFCAKCVKTRLDTRQRKCPTCAQAFSAEDVRPVYFV